MIQQTSPISVSVAEHSDIGTLVAVISAVDTMDYGVNTRVIYEIISGNEDCEYAACSCIACGTAIFYWHVCLSSAKFAINNETGVLSVAGDLDHENITQYHIRVQAREHLGVPASTPDTVRLDYHVPKCH